jgi:hypothetical protein
VDQEIAPRILLLEFCHRKSLSFQCSICSSFADM